MSKNPEIAQLVVERFVDLDGKPLYFNARPTIWCRF